MNHKDEDWFRPYFKSSSDRIMELTKEINRLSANIDVEYKQVSVLAKEILAHCNLCEELDA